MLRALRDAFKHTSIYTIGNLASKAIGFIMIPIYTHFLAPKEYGIMDMLDLTIVLIGMLVGMGMGSAVFRFYYACTDDRERREVIGSALLFNTVVAGSVGLVVALFAGEISSLIFRTPEYAHYLRLAILAFWIGTLGDTCKNYLRVRQRSVFFVSTALVQLAIGLALNIYFIAYLRWGVLGFLYSTLITNGVMSLVLLVHMIREAGFAFSWSRTRLMLSYGFPFVFSGIGLFVLNFADRYFLNTFAGLQAVGIYALGYKFGFMINMLVVAPFLQMWQAQMFIVEKDPNAKAIYVRTFEYFAAILLFAVLGLSIFIKDALRLMAGPEYFGAYAIVPLIALAYVFSGWAQFFRLGMLLTRRTRTIATIMAGTSVVTLFLYWALIRSFHAYGAALATLASFAFMTTWTYIASQRLFPVRYNVRRILGVLGLGAACYGAALGIDAALGEGHRAVGFALRALPLAAYPLVLVYTGYFASEGIHRLSDLPAGIRRIARGGEAAGS